MLRFFPRHTSGKIFSVSFLSLGNRLKRRSDTVVSDSAHQEFIMHSCIIPGVHK